MELEDTVEDLLVEELLELVDVEVLLVEEVFEPDDNVEEVFDEVAVAVPFQFPRSVNFSTVGSL